MNYLIKYLFKPRITLFISAISSKDETVTKGNKIMKNIGETVKKILTKTWIWIVAINLFVVAITGERMTGFRIIYMFLFLFFILTFQVNIKIYLKYLNNVHTLWTLTEFTSSGEFKYIYTFFVLLFGVQICSHMFI